MKKRVRWINTNESRQRDEAGNWESAEGRFVIFPRYRHTVNPDSYEVTDYMGTRSVADGHATLSAIKATFDTVRAAKAWAEQRAKVMR